MPKIVDHEERRRVIATACWRTIVKQGIVGATTRQIAKEAGVSLGVLAHYFGDKEGVVVGALDELVARFDKRMRDETSLATSPSDRVRRLLVSYLPLDAQRRLESGVWLSFWAHGYTSDILRGRQQAAYRYWIDRLALAVNQAIDAGELRADLRADLEALHLAAVVDGLTVQMILAEKPNDLAADVIAVVDRLLEDLSQGPPQRPEPSLA